VLRGLLFASRGHFSDTDSVSVASQAAEGQGISCVPRSLFRYNSCVAAAEGKPKDSSVESDPGCLGSMSICDAVQWVKLSKTWPKLKFFDFHKMLKNLLEGNRKFSG
jgi:hypothetical protein